MLVPWQNRLGRRYDHMMSKSRRKWCKINLQVQDETKGKTVITCNYNEIEIRIRIVRNSFDIWVELSLF